MLKLSDKRCFLHFDKDDSGMFYEAGYEFESRFGAGTHTQGTLTINQCKKLQEYLRQRIIESEAKDE